MCKIGAMVKIKVVKPTIATNTIRHFVVLKWYLAYFWNVNSIFFQWFKTMSGLKLIFKYVKNYLEEIFYLSYEQENGHTTTWGILVSHIAQNQSHVFLFFSSSLILLIIL